MLRVPLVRFELARVSGRDAASQAFHKVFAFFCPPVRLTWLDPAGRPPKRESGIDPGCDRVGEYVEQMIVHRTALDCVLSLQLLPDC